MSMQTILRTLFVSAICALGACGGGGSGNSGSSNTTGTSSTPNPAFAPLNHWTVPTGPRIDVSAQNLFPFSIGDSITYDRKTAAGTNGTVVRTIVPTTGRSLRLPKLIAPRPKLTKPSTSWGVLTAKFTSKCKTRSAHPAWR